MVGSDDSLANFNHQLNTCFKYHPESIQNELGQHIMNASTNSSPSPMPQEKHDDAFKRVPENVFSYGEHGKLWNPFYVKYYWMDDKTQFCIYSLISLSQDDIEELVNLWTPLA
jgi:hypothetical protein